MCRNYCGGCAWSRDFKEVKGWTAVVKKNKKGKIDRAWVSWCPEFKADAGLYDLFVKGKPQDVRWHIHTQYGHMTELLYITIRYHLVNDYERGRDDNASKL
jgi:hypothetical protein